MGARRRSESAGARSPRERQPRRAGAGALAVALGAAALVTASLGAYFVARETSLFALRRIEVKGATPEVAGRVRTALGPLVGRSLVAFDSDAAGRRLSTLPEIAGTSFDRSFPHTLRVFVRVERPVAVLRRGSEAWLVSSSARVLRRLDARPWPRLPRIWVPRSDEVAVNATLGGAGAKGVRAVAPLAPLRLKAAVRLVRASDDELTLVLGSGRELRLGDTGDVRLKLAIASRLLPVTEGAAYVDVSVPERPVAGYNPQVIG